MAKFDSLPDKTIKQIALLLAQTEGNRGFSAVARVSRRCHALLNPILYGSNLAYHRGTAAVWAAKMGQAGTLERLYEHGGKALVTAVWDHADHTREFVARLRRRHADEVGAFQNRASYYRRSSSARFVTPWVGPDMSFTLLHVAAAYGRTNVMAWLIWKGADVEAPCSFFCGCTRQWESGPNYASDQVLYLHPPPYTPLHIAICNRQTRAARLLLAMHACPFRTVTVRDGEKRQVDLGPDNIWAVNPGHPTLLCTAAAAGCVEMMDTLVERGVLVNFQHASGTETETDCDSALHYATMCRTRPDVVTALVRLGADLGARNGAGHWGARQRPVELAIQRQNFGVALKLFALRRRVWSADPSTYATAEDARRDEAITVWVPGAPDGGMLGHVGIKSIVSCIVEATWCRQAWVDDPTRYPDRSTWLKERDAFLAELVRCGLPVRETHVRVAAKSADITVALFESLLKGFVVDWEELKRREYVELEREFIASPYLEPAPAPALALALSGVPRHATDAVQLLNTPDASGGTPFSHVLWARDRSDYPDEHRRVISFLLQHHAQLDYVFPAGAQAKPGIPLDRPTTLLQVVRRDPDETHTWLYYWLLQHSTASNRHDARPQVASGASLDRTDGDTSSQTRRAPTL